MNFKLFIFYPFDAYMSSTSYTKIQFLPHIKHTASSLQRPDS